MTMQGVILGSDWARWCAVDDSRTRNRPFRNAQEIGDWTMLGISIVDQSAEERQNDETQALV